MVTICTKKFMNTREKLLSYTGRSNRESKDLEDFLKRLKERGEKGGGSRVLSGTSVPNSTFKSLQSNEEWRNKKNGSSLSAGELGEMKKEENKRSVNSIKSFQFSSKNSIAKIEESSQILIEPDKRTSILSGTGTLEELKELKNLLHKSSYVPKQTRTRRPTIEKIKSAIEKEKLTLNDKNESTIEESVTQSDASTSTLKKKKKKANTKNDASTSILTGSNTEQGIKKKKRKKKVKKKSTSSVDAEIQCSLYKIRKAEVTFSNL